MNFYTSAYNIDLMGIIDENLSTEKKLSLLKYIYNILKQDPSLTQDTIIESLRDQDNTIKIIEKDNNTQKPKTNTIKIDLYDIEIDLDVWNVYEEMDRWDKEEMADLLESDGHLKDYIESNSEGPSTLEEVFNDGHTPLEGEFGVALYKLWQSRLYLNQEQKERVYALCKESYV